MQKINKGKEPEKLTRWKHRNPTNCYKNLTEKERQSIRQICLKEQYYLCAYCCYSISMEDSHNEHIQPQSIESKQTLNFHNIVASCEKPNQCGKAHGKKIMSLTPLMIECETELKYYLSGKVKGTTERATNTINILNLGDGNKALINKRKQLVDALIYRYGERPENCNYWMMICYKY
ncbi:retron system putative HNH endonuclease [Thiotrichales bacterium HSG1]|nr:retron system putative HNH endonuclease [Thiotrichales bacterium HSG1]